MKFYSAHQLTSVLSCGKRHFESYIIIVILIHDRNHYRLNPIIRNFIITNETRIMVNAEKPVSSIMTSETITVRLSDSFEMVYSILEKNGIHHVIVLNDGQVKGIISSNDIKKVLASSYLEKKRSPMVNLKAFDIMTGDPIVINSDDSIGLAADIILSNKLHSIPVVNDGELVGIVTSHDLLKYAYV